MYSFCTAANDIRDRTNIEKHISCEAFLTVWVWVVWVVCECVCGRACLCVCLFSHLYVFCVTCSQKGTAPAKIPPYRKITHQFINAKPQQQTSAAKKNTEITA